MGVERISRVPCGPLRPFVRLVWAVEESDAPARAQRHEHVLPTGAMHIVIRLGQDPLRLYAGPQDRTGTLAGDAMVGGARDTFYGRLVSGPQCSVGAQLRPGGGEALLGVPAAELAGRHTPLDDIWGAAVAAMRERLPELPLAERLDAFEAWLLARLPRVRAMHPAVAQLLSEFTVRGDVGRAIAGTGYSHRAMITLFRRSVGLAPKEYVRVLRFTRALARMRAGHALADVALAAGYSDQAHFSREFRAFAGATPSHYLRIAPPDAHHLPVGSLP